MESGVQAQMPTPTTMMTTVGRTAPILTCLGTTCVHGRCLRVVTSCRMSPTHVGSSPHCPAQTTDAMVIDVGEDVKGGHVGFNR